MKQGRTELTADERLILEEAAKIKRRIWHVGDVVQMNELALDNYGEEYAGIPLTITHVATSVEEHPGFDESSGSALYDFDEFPFQLYEWELDWYDL